MQNVVLSERLKAQCKMQKTTIKTMLERCEMNRNFIYDLEKKCSFPSADKLSRIADYLDCSVDYLLGRTDIPNVTLSEKEKKLLEAYHNHPEVMTAVDRILEIDESYESTTKKPYTPDFRIAAYGGDNIEKKNKKPRIT